MVTLGIPWHVQTKAIKDRMKREAAAKAKLEAEKEAKK